MTPSDALIADIYGEVRNTHKSTRGNVARDMQKFLDPFVENEMWKCFITSLPGEDAYQYELDVIEAKFNLLVSWLNTISELFPEKEDE